MLIYISGFQYEKLSCQTSCHIYLYFLLFTLIQDSVELNELAFGKAVLFKTKRRTSLFLQLAIRKNLKKISSSKLLSTKNRENVSSTV